MHRRAFQEDAPPKYFPWPWIRLATKNFFLNLRYELLDQIYMVRMAVHFFVYFFLFTLAQEVKESVERSRSYSAMLWSDFTGLYFAIRNDSGVACCFEVLLDVSLLL